MLYIITENGLDMIYKKISPLFSFFSFTYTNKTFHTQNCHLCPLAYFEDPLIQYILDWPLSPGATPASLAISFVVLYLGAKLWTGLDSGDRQSPSARTLIKSEPCVQEINAPQADDVTRAKLLEALPLLVPFGKGVPSEVRMMKLIPN